MRTSLLLAISIFISACGNEAGLMVRYKGALRDFMHNGDISAKISLADLKNEPNLYALGAVENLKGEILILKSKPVISFVENGQLKFDNSFKKNAALLVFARVEKWQKIAIPKKIRTYSELEEFILGSARGNNIDTEEPFPFMLNGKVESVEWHVMDWKEGDTEHTPEKHKNSGLRGTLTDENVQILGFYSNKHRAIFTHHSTNMHLHLLSENEDVAGHLDEVVLSDSTILLLPDLE